MDPNIGAVHGTLNVGKLMEAIAYHLCHHDDPEWRTRVDELVDAMADAQLSDGFLLPIRQWCSGMKCLRKLGRHIPMLRHTS